MTTSPACILRLRTGLHMAKLRKAGDVSDGGGAQGAMPSSSVCMYSRVWEGLRFVIEGGMLAMWICDTGKVFPKLELM